MTKQIQTVGKRKPWDDENFYKAEGVSDKNDTNHGLAKRDYSVSCSTPSQNKIAVVGGFFLWWCSAHHQPYSWCEKAKLKQDSAQAQQEAVERSVYVLTAYDTEKERNGEVIVIDNKEQALEIEKTLQSIYGVRNVMFASRRINDIPVVILEALQTKGQE